MPNTLAEKKQQDSRRLSTEFLEMLGHYLDLGKTEEEHQTHTKEVEEVIHDLSKKYRAAARGCPVGYKQCADGGCVPRGRNCGFANKRMPPR